MTDSVSLLSLAVARRNLNISFVMFDILSGMNSLLRLELLSKCASQVCSGALLMLLQSTYCICQYWHLSNIYMEKYHCNLGLGYIKWYPRNSYLLSRIHSLVQISWNLTMQLKQCNVQKRWGSNHPLNRCPLSLW